ncbi:MAG: acetate--CoA ligase [Planctomycetota bacterium]|nr:acetate--CoA ligase [Planctomycetota bacterium]
MNSTIFPPNPQASRDAHINSMEQYREMYQRSVDDPEAFWCDIAKEFKWEKSWNQPLEYDFESSIDIQWFLGGRTNISVNAIDRHLETRGDQVAIIWEGNEPGEERKLTYRELHQEVCRFANVLKERGVKKGDRVTLYMPMVPELAIAMLSCARLGAVHSVVFAGFSAEALADRLIDCSCSVLVTSDGLMRGQKVVPLKEAADRAMDRSAAAGVEIQHCIVLERLGPEVLPITMTEGRDFWWKSLMESASDQCEPEWVESEDPLFILYTSGSTGKPKGVLHTTGGYMVYTTTTFRWIFDYQEGDIYWCTADCGWVTGHSYIVYGPLCAGATTLMFEGIPTYPDAGRFWDVVEKYQVNQFYTAPTAIRALMGFGDDPVNARNVNSLRLLGTVGEPINPEAWRWYHRVVGKERCPIVDTWWQTETGGILISPLPGATPTKPGSATLPFFGVRPVLVDDEGSRLEGAATGNLCIEKPWPSTIRTVYGEHQRLKETYFERFPGLYFTGDGCRRDEDGYYWITGRVDDVINVSGHRMGTAEVESALVSHSSVSEAAVVGFPHEIKGQGIYAYVTLVQGVDSSESLRQELVNHVRSEIGPIASPDTIHWAPGLPKTRSGKIMRRILRKIAAGETQDLGDTSTLADPAVVEDLIASVQVST